MCLQNHKLYYKIGKKKTILNKKRFLKHIYNENKIKNCFDGNKRMI